MIKLMVCGEDEFILEYRMFEELQKDMGKRLGSRLINLSIT